MIIKSNRKNLTLFSFFQERVLWVLLLFFVQNFNSQIFISEGAIIHLEKKALVSQTDSLLSNPKKNKIYASSGIHITILDTEKNYEIIKILPSENRKTKLKKQPILNIDQQQSEKKIEPKIASKKENPFLNKHIFSKSKSEIYFSFQGGFSKIILSVYQFHVKQIISSEGYKTSLSYKWRKLKFEHFKRAELITSQNKSAIPLRAPPCLV